MPKIVVDAAGRPIVPRRGDIDSVVDGIVRQEVKRAERTLGYRQHFCREIQAPWEFVFRSDQSMLVFGVAIPPQDYPAGAHVLLGTGEETRVTHPVEDAVLRYRRFKGEQPLLADIGELLLAEARRGEPTAAALMERYDNFLRNGHCVFFAGPLLVPPRQSFFSKIVVSKMGIDADGKQYLSWEPSNYTLRVHVFGLLSRDVA